MQGTCPSMKEDSGAMVLCSTAGLLQTSIVHCLFLSAWIFFLFLLLSIGITSNRSGRFTRLEALYAPTITTSCTPHSHILFSLHFPFPPFLPPSLLLGGPDPTQHIMTPNKRKLPTLPRLIPRANPPRLLHHRHVACLQVLNLGQYPTLSH